MKVIKRILILMFFTSIFFFIPVHAEKPYLEAKDYISIGMKDVTSEVNAFLNACKAQNKNAYFNKGIYKIKGTVSLKNGVSIIGEPGAILQGTDAVYQSHMQDNVESVSDIFIEHLVLDNVTLYFKGAESTNIVIQNNVFMNARKVDTSISTGLQPDENNKNGGESTGYYISKNYNKIDILSNLFLRDAHSLGRGIGIYKTKDAVIQDNYFGLLEDIENSIVSDETKALKQLILSLHLLDENSNQGYFMTGINVINSDKDVTILGNHLSFNKDITEAGYEDGSQSTSGYNRDHFIYAKMYDGLEIVGNYFKGMNKNQDGAVKCRNGQNLWIYKNIFEDSLILLYVQNAKENLWLKNVLIEENIFINQDYDPKLVEIPSGSTTLKKYITIDYLILIKNYDATAVVDNITIQSNHILSAALANEQIRIDNTQYSMPTNLWIQDNKNELGQLARLTILNTKDQSNYDSNQGDSPNFTTGTKYVPAIKEEYKALSIKDQAKCNVVDFEIDHKRILTEADSIYVDGSRYSGEILSNGSHHLLFVKNTTTTILVENEAYTISSYVYTNCEIFIEDTYTLYFETFGHGKESWSEEAARLPEELLVLIESGWIFKGWYLDEEFKTPAVTGNLLEQDTTVYAKWEKEIYTISFNTMGHGITPNAITGTKLPDNLPVLSEAGWTFEGWYMDNNFQSLALAGEEIFSNVALYAKWERIAYSISFERNGKGEEINTIYGVTMIPTLPTPKEEGYRFLGWYLDETFHTQAIEGTSIQKNTTLYAKWEVVKYYKVVFQLIGEGIVKEEHIKEGAQVMAPVLEPKEGYHFKGWFIDEACSTFWNFDDVIEKDTELFGLWVLLPKGYTIQFELNGHGLQIENINEAMKLPTSLPIPEAEGYSFKGWYLDATFSKLAQPGIEIHENVTLYAQWEKIIKQYKVIFYIADYGALVEIKVEEFKKITRPEDPIIEGKTFYGWYEDETYTTKFDFDKDVITKETILYGKWIEDLPSPQRIHPFLIVGPVLAGMLCIGLGIVGVVIYKKRKK